MEVLAAALHQRQQKASRCAITGLSTIALGKIGTQLSVDRVDNTKGYIKGNVRLIAACLNSAKGSRRDVPPVAVKRLMERHERVRHDELSANP